MGDLLLLRCGPPPFPESALLYALRFLEGKRIPPPSLIRSTDARSFSPLYIFAATPESLLQVHNQSAIDGERRSGAVRRIVRGKKQKRPGKVLRFTKPL